MTTNAEVIAFLYMMMFMPDDQRTAEELMAIAGCVKKLLFFDKCYGELERITKIEIKPVGEDAEEDLLEIYDYFSDWEMELEILLDYFDRFFGVK